MATFGRFQTIVEGTIKKDEIRALERTGSVTRPVTLRRCVAPSDEPVAEYCSAESIWQRYLDGEEK